MAQFLRRMNELAASVLSFAVLSKSMGYGRTRLFPLSSPRTGTTVGAGLAPKNLREVWVESIPCRGVDEVWVSAIMRV
jgi:hypothetical protein